MSLFVHFEKNSTTPLHKQLFIAIKEAITSGKLTPGERLPSTRDMAEDLDIARNTVSSAYDQLMSEGLIESVPGSGMYICDQGTKQIGQSETTTSASDYPLTRFAESIADEQAISNAFMSYRLPRRQDLPTSKWHQLVQKHSKLERNSAPEWCSDVLGYVPLREALAHYLEVSRGLVCKKEQLVLFPSRREALDFWCKVLIEPGQTIAMERPGNPMVRRLFKACDINVCAIDVSSGYLTAQQLVEHEDVKAIYLTPSQQAISGVIMPAEERRHLVEWAQDRKAIIIEDDFDCEFVMQQERLQPAIQSFDRGGNVVYIGSFANSLAPLTEQAYSLVPESVLRTTRRAREIFAGCAARLDEKVLAEFLKSGDFFHYVRKLRGTYARRRSRLEQEIKASSRRITIQAHHTSTSLLVELDTKLLPDQVELCASKAGLPVISCTPFYGNAANKNQFLLSYCRVPESDAKEAVSLFEAYLNECEINSVSAIFSKIGRMSFG
jgi:GntR family transcriptional regulator/MocR family aminotransferase